MRKRVVLLFDFNFSRTIYPVLPFFFVLTQKRNKKSQGFEKMTKNYFTSLNAANSPHSCFILQRYHGLGQRCAFNGLFRNFLNAIFSRPHIQFMQIILLAPVLILLSFEESFCQQKFQLAPPMLKYESGFFSGKTSFEIIFNQPGAEVRYTLNGNEPTQKDLLYSKAVSITKKTLVKVKAFGNDFLPSETVTASFITEGKKIKQAIYSKPNESYANSKANILHDNIGGQVNYRSGSWVGFDSDTVTVDIELQKKESVSKVLISLLQDENSWIFLPEQILAYYYSDQQKAFLPLGKETFQFDEPRPKQVNIREIQPSMAITTKQLKLVLFPLKKNSRLAWWQRQSWLALS